MQRLHRVTGLIVVVGQSVRAVEPAREEQVGQAREQVLEIDVVEVLAGELGVAVFHSGLSSASRSFGGPAVAWRGGLVVVLLLVPGQRDVAFDHLLGRHTARRPARRRLCALILELFRAGDLLLRVESLEDEVDRGCDERRRRLAIDADGASPARARPGPVRRARSNSAAGSVSSICSVPPRSNHSVTCLRSTPAKYPPNTLPTAARMMSRATLSAPRSSPSYSSSNLPVIAGSAA